MLTVNGIQFEFYPNFRCIVFRSKLPFASSNLTKSFLFLVFFVDGTNKGDEGFFFHSGGNIKVPLISSKMDEI